MAIANGNTTAQAYAFDLPTDPKFDLKPLLTVGDEIPLLEGSGLKVSPSSSKKFALAGIPDGLGYTQVGNKYYVFVNHELANTAISNFNSTDATKIQGARVSLLAFDLDWKIVGGKNLIEQVTDSTGTYTLNTTTGKYEKDANTFSFGRFCSAYLAEQGFVGADGKATPIFLTAEETDNKSRGWAIGVDGNALALDGLGRYSKENVVAASQYRAKNSNKTVLLSTEDTTDGELYMFVGEQTKDDPNGFKNGDLYALKVKDVDTEGQIKLNQPLEASWVKVPKDRIFNADGTAKADGTDLTSFTNTKGNSTNFRRIEDIAEDPNKPGTFYFNDTGTKDKQQTDPTKPTGDGLATVAADAENPYGRLYRFSLNSQDPTGAIKDFELLLKGGPDVGVSFDNIVVDRNGKVLLQEDETAFGGEQMTAEKRDARVYAYDIATKKVTPLFELNETLGGTLADKGPGVWESSGIVEIDPKSAPGQSSYLFGVQAHSIIDPKYVEGGQLLLATPKAKSATEGVLTTYNWDNLPVIGTTAIVNPQDKTKTVPGQNIKLGGFSGLKFEGVAANGNLKFITHTDRGPNAENVDLLKDVPGKEKPFLLPNFQPEIDRFELNAATGKISLTQRIKLTSPDGKPLTGLPNIQAAAEGLAYADEVPIDLFGNRLPNDPLGADLEGIAVAKDGTFWLADEYRPSIYHFDVNGKLIERLIPGGTATAKGTFGTPVLPEVYAQRRANRGFEGIAIDGNKVYAFVQSGLDNPDVANDANSKASGNLRILEYDTVSKKVTGEYLYQLTDVKIADKLGDATSLGNGKFLIAERDSSTTVDSFKSIFEIDITKATNISIPKNIAGVPAGKTIDQLTTAELAAAKITTASKKLITSATALGYTGVEKLEGLTVVDNKTIAIINDNDFGVGLTPIIGDGKVPELNENAPVKLGLISLKNPLDSSAIKPKDGGTNLGDNIFLPVKNLDFDKNNHLDLRADKGQIDIRFKTNNDAVYNNSVGFYRIDDATGKIGNLKPGDVGYIQAALNQSLLNMNKQADRDVNLAGGALYAPYLIANGTLDDFLTKNPTNNNGNNLPQAYFSFAGANADKIDHLKSLGGGKFGWEDTFGGGDRDFNDTTLQISKIG